MTSARVFTRLKRERARITAATPTGTLTPNGASVRRRAGTGGTAERTARADDRAEGSFSAEFTAAPGRLPGADQPALVHSRAAREDRGDPARNGERGNGSDPSGIQLAGT